MVLYRGDGFKETPCSGKVLKFPRKSKKKTKCLQLAEFFLENKENFNVFNATSNREIRIQICDFGKTPLILNILRILIYLAGIDIGC